MILDDDKELLEELVDVLFSSGYDIFAFSGGRSALERVETIMPDIILLDLRMEKMSGFQFADRLRAMPAMEKIPVIAMSGYFRDDEHSTTMKICGIDHFIDKPFDPADMINKIEEVLKKGALNEKSATRKKEG